MTHWRDIRWSYLQNMVSSRNLRMTRWYLMLALVIGGPFHAFLITWVKTFPSMWREVIVSGIGLLLIIEWICKKTRPKFDVLDILILAYLFLSLLFLPFQSEKAIQWLLGFRFDVLPLFFFFIVRHGEWPKKEKLAKWALAASTAVMIFGLLHTLVLPQNFLTHFGYSQNKDLYRTGVPIAACQLLEHNEQVCRATSTFGGPTRYGTYLLLIIGLLLPFLMEPLKGKSKIRYAAWGLLFLAILNIILTYSRSIWIGAIFMGGAALWFFVKQKKIRILIGSLGILVITLVSFIFLSFAMQKQTSPWTAPPLLKTIFTRVSSTSEHFQAVRKGIETVLKNPLGIGLGKAGPASFRFEKFLTENWYLQIAIEMGILGLLFFLGILFLLFKKLLSGDMNLQKIGLFLSLLGISVAGLFTHSFEETTTVLMLFGGAGILLSPKLSSVPRL